MFRIKKLSFIMIAIIMFMESILGGSSIFADTLEEINKVFEESEFFEEIKAEYETVKEENEIDETINENIEDIEKFEEVTEEIEEMTVNIDNIEENADNTEEEINEKLEEIIKDEVYKKGEEEFFDFNDILTSGGSIEIEKYNIETEELSEECINILKEDNYILLEKGERYILTAELGLRDETMVKCAEKGLTVKDSYVYAVIMQQLDVNLIDAVKMIAEFGSEVTGREEAKKFRYAKIDYGFMEDDETKGKFLYLLLKGNSMDKIINSYAVSRALGISIKEAMEKYEEGSENYQENEEKIMNAKEELGLLEYDIMPISTEEDEYKEYLRGPFNLEDNTVEQIDTRKGTLQYIDDIVNIPGKNGLNININMTYNVTDYYDKNIGYNCGIYGTCWSMGGITRLGRDEEWERGEWEPNYVMFADGSKYDFHCTEKNGL